MVDSISEYRHELLTPMNHIIGYCEILVEDAEAADEDAQRALAPLKSILEQGTRLLEDIERTLPSAEVAAEADLPALRVRLLSALPPMVETCDRLLQAARTGALPLSPEDLDKVRTAATTLIDLAGRIPAGETASPGPPGP